MLRYITRAVLIPFHKSSISLSPNERRKLDLELKTSMQAASRGVGTIIKLGRKIIEDDESMERVMEKLKSMLEVRSNNINQRIYQSYSLLILSSLKVSYISCMFIALCIAIATYWLLRALTKYDLCYATYACCIAMYLCYNLSS